MPQLVPCPLCGGAKSRKLKEDCGVDVVRCSDCRFLYINPQPTAAELEDLYSRGYYGVCADLMADSLKDRHPVFRRGVEIISSLQRPGRVLDVGCGAGDFLEFAERAGWQAFGVDPSDCATTFARTKGLKVTCGTLAKAEYPAGLFDVVTMWDVLEHLTDPKGAVEGASRVLKPRGFLVIRVPNTNFQLLKAFVRENVLRGPRDSLLASLHLNHFTPASLRRLLKSVSFEVMREEAGVSEDKVHRPGASLWFKKAYCSAMELFRKTTTLHLGPTMVICARKVSNG